MFTTENQKNGKNNICICNSIGEYIDLIEKHSNKNSTTSVYRGHSKTSYELKPAIGRIQNYSIDTEKNIFLEFKSKYHSLTSLHLDRDMDVLFLAQHYGLPTRLLDWTYNSIIALYMACSSNANDNGVVFIKQLSNNNVSEIKEDESPFNISKNKLIIPDYWDVRFINQKGLFECFANPQESSTDYHAKIILPAEKKGKLLMQLSLIGIDRNFIYPTLDNLCNTIKEQNKIQFT